MLIDLPEQIKTVLTALSNKGFEAYIVGGCVRDKIMGKTPFDWDVSTGAKPEEIAETFSDFKVIETGIKHGTLTVIIDKMPVEITTFRVDGTYSDNRHPDSVIFTGDLSKDLSRRDFTVNALAYSPGTGIIDCFNGVNDIKNRVMRCVGTPDERFGEDALRILRALRFASVLGFEIETETAKSLLRNKERLNNIAAERIHVELIKLLGGIDVQRILDDYRDIIFQIIPELAHTGVLYEDGKPEKGRDNFTYTTKRVGLVKNEPELRMAMLLRDIGKPLIPLSDKNSAVSLDSYTRESENIALQVLWRLKLSKRFIGEVGQIIRYHDIPLFDDPKALKKRLIKLGEPMLRKILHAKRADLLTASGCNELAVLKVDETEAELERIISGGICYTIADLKVNGSDLLDAGVSPGTNVGKILKKLFAAVISDEITNEKEALLNKVIQIIGETEK
ncbi:MAG: CCA tRNA nucleotidyltransferase [Acutalibacteraceae bacterium]